MSSKIIEKEDLMIIVATLLIPALMILLLVLATKENDPIKPFTVVSDNLPKMTCNNHWTENSFIVLSGCTTHSGEYVERIITKEKDIYFFKDGKP